MIIREFGERMYATHTKGQQHKVYASIRWLYGLFRNTNALTSDKFFNPEYHGYGINSLIRTFYLMADAPKLLFPITYGFEHHLGQHPSVSSMVWNFDRDEQENIFE